MCDDLKLKHLFACFVGGSSGSGKSSFCIRLLQNLKALCTEPKFNGGIILCYSKRSAVPYRQLAATKSFHFLRRSVSRSLQRWWKTATHNPRWFVTQRLFKERVTYFRKAAITGIWVSFLLPRTTFMRGSPVAISRWTHSNSGIKNSRGKNQFYHLARQVYPEGSDGLYKAYLVAIERPDENLLLDLSQDTNDRLTCRTRKFPSEYPPTMNTDIKNESNKVKLPSSSRTQIGPSKTT